LANFSLARRTKSYQKTVIDFFEKEKILVKDDFCLLTVFCHRLH
jgi:hypothetical protein